MTKNALTSEGLQIQTIDEIQQNLITGYQDIYGQDINLDSNSPDGQLIYIFAQAMYDTLSTLQDVYTSFDPEQASGEVLDARVAINGIQRKPGSYTTCYVDITTDRLVEIIGLYDSITKTQNSEELCYTVKDNVGNLYIATESMEINNTTKHIQFRAKDIGSVTPVTGSINQALDIILGITKIDNLEQTQETPTEIGRDGELDSELRQRRRWSLALSSSGGIEGLTGALMNIPGVIKVHIFENYTNTTDIDHIPPHSIWPVVEYTNVLHPDPNNPSFTSMEVIAKTIYQYKSAGCGMFGSQSCPIITQSGQTFNVKFDKANPVTLYLKFDLMPRLSSRQLSEAEQILIKQEILDNFIYSIAQVADSSDMIAFLVPLLSDFYVDNLLFSKNNVDWDTLIEPTHKVDHFVLKQDSIQLNTITQETQGIDISNKRTWRNSAVGRIQTAQKTVFIDEE